YNRANLLTKAIESCLHQSFKDFEVIVVDDGSTDNTQEVVQSFLSDKIRYYQIPNSERGYARNFGAEEASGQWLYFLDSDDIIYPHHLITAYQIIFENPDIQIFHLAYEIVNFTSNKKVIRNIPSDSIIRGNKYSCHGMFIKKSFFLQHPFNTDRTIAGLEDWELWLRISTQTEIKHFPIVTSAIIQHPERSVMQVNKEKWIQKVETFIHYVVMNKHIVQKYKKQLPQFYCSAYTYLALHLSFDKKNKKETWNYFVKGLKYYPLFLFSPRSLVIMRNLLFSLLKINSKSN
ncbi:MAG: glycosyltransferase family 2 protein, partial [Bacteroidia bacterium]|nr:glycosyltransferase family 2 protein [Bacteroidia bacterium]